MAVSRFIVQLVFVWVAGGFQVGACLPVCVGWLVIGVCFVCVFCVWGPLLFEGCLPILAPDEPWETRPGGGSGSRSPAIFLPYVLFENKPEQTVPW